MSRRAILIIILVLLLGTGALYFLLRGGISTTSIPTLSGLPFGKAPEGSGAGENGTGTGESGSGVGSTGRPLAKFYKLVPEPVAGFKGFIKNGSENVRYVDRATGHVYDINPTTLERTQIFNTTQPKVYAAIFKSDASGFLERSVSPTSEVVSNTSITLTAPKATSTGGLYNAQATLLRGDVSDTTVAADGSLLYVLRSSGAVITSSFVGGNPKTLVSLPFTDWHIAPISATSALLTTKATYLAPGYSYILNTKSGGLTKVLGPLTALSSLPSPDGRTVAYGYQNAATYTLSTINFSTKRAADIVPVTLPEKCVWSPKLSSILYCGVPSDGLGTNIPDNWYQGLTHYSDKIWRFNVDTGTSEMLLDSKKDFNTEVDATSLALSPDEDYLFFINKNDFSLYTLKISR